MGSITIRNLNGNTERQLRLRAARHKRSVEEEARDILRCALTPDAYQQASWVDRIREIVEPLGGIELEWPARGPIREPPDFS